MLHHLIRSAARTSSRPLFSQFNKAIIVSNSRLPFAQSSKFVSKSTSRALFAQSNKSAVISNQSALRRTHSGYEKKSCLNLAVYALIGSLSGVVLLFGVLSCTLPAEKEERQRQQNYSQNVSPNPCVTKYDPLPKTCTSKVAYEKPDRFEDGKVSFALAPTTYTAGNRVLLVDAHVDFALPNTTLAADCKQICDELKQRGIHVKRSEEGARIGLTEYALKCMQRGVNDHLQQKMNCSCVDQHGCAEAQPERAIPQNFEKHVKYDIHSSTVTPHADDKVKKPDPFETVMIEFSLLPILAFTDSAGTMHLRLRSGVQIDLIDMTVASDYKQICDGLDLSGIRVEKSRLGARIGLTQLALEYMQKGVAEHLPKECGVDKECCRCRGDSAPSDQSRNMYRHL